MQNDFISRSALLKYMESTEISQYIDELNNGNDNYNSTPMYDFVKELPIVYNVEKVVEQLEAEKIKNIEPESTHAFMWNSAIQKAIACVVNGGRGENSR